MKIYLYISLLAVIMLSGCENPDNDIIGEISTCELYADISYPGVWQFRMHEFEGKDIPSHIHFVDASQGFVAGNSTDYGQAYAYKTLDGGLSWNSYNMNFHERASSFCFLDGSSAFVGIEQQPGGAARLARTADGGVTWSTLEYEGLNGSLVDMYFLNEEKGFAILQANTPRQDVSLLKTINAGQSWEVIFTNPSLMHTDCKLSMSITTDFIYRVGAGGDIYKLDHSGQMVSNIQVPETEIHQLQVVSDNILYVVTTGGLYSSQDAGLTWAKKMDGVVKIGVFFDENAGLVVQNASHCVSDANHAHDALAATQDQGNTWIKGNLISNLLMGLSDRQLVNPDLAVCLFENRLVFCSR